MENVKKSSRFGVRLSAVMVAVLLVVCMAVPAFAENVEITGFPDVVFPDSSRVSIVYDRPVEFGGGTVAFYSDDVPTSANLRSYYMYTTLTSSGNYRVLAAVPEEYLDEYPYCYVKWFSGKVSDYDLYMCKEPLYCVDSSDSEYLLFSSDGTMSVEYLYFTTSYSNPWEYEGKYSASRLRFQSMAFNSHSYLTASGGTVPADKFLTKILISGITTSYTSILSDNSWGSWSSGSTSSFYVYRPSDVLYSSLDIFDGDGNVVVESPKGFIVRVNQGLTIVLDWVGATVSALFSGSLSGLLPLVAVPVAITLLLVAIIVIKRSIWGA